MIISNLQGKNKPEHQIRMAISEEENKMASPEKQDLLLQAEENQSYARAQLGGAGLVPMGQLKDLDELMPKPGGKLCLGMECLDRFLWDPRPAYDDIQKMGVYSVRIQSGWARNEPEEGVYDFAALDEEIEELLKRGILPWLCLCYGHPLYYEGDANALRAGGIGHVPIHTERERMAWKNYVKKVVTRYSGRIKRFEVWNEPDVSVFFLGETDWVKSYLDLLALTVPVIREAAPDAQIIACTGSYMGLEALLKGGMGDLVDQYSFHNYSEYPEGQSADVRTALRNLRDAYAPELTLIRGEAGCPSYNAPTSFGALHDMKTSETIQAKWAARHLIADFADPAVAETSYFHAYEFLHFSLQHHYYYGAIRRDYSRKPVYFVLQRLARLFDGDTQAEPRWSASFHGQKKEDTPLVKCFAFERRGLPLFAYWRAEEICDQSAITMMKPRFLPSPGWKCPVLLDLLTGDLYALKDQMEALPVAGYPLILTEAEALQGLIPEDRLEKLLKNAGKGEAEKHSQYVEG